MAYAGSFLAVKEVLDYFSGLRKRSPTLSHKATFEKLRLVTAAVPSTDGREGWKGWNCSCPVAKISAIHHSG